MYGSCGFFHFSPRYAGRAEEIYQEAEASFRGASLQAADEGVFVRK